MRDQLATSSGKLKRGYGRLEGNICDDCLTGNIIRDTDGSGLGHTTVEDQSRLDLSGGEAVARDVDDI
jgi:hypothetical protein